MTDFQVELDREFLKLVSSITKLGRQATSILARSLNVLARKAEEALKAEMKEELDRPKPWTLRAFHRYSAQANSLESGLFLKDIQTGRGHSWEQTLKQLFIGGSREFKLFEGIIWHKEIIPSGKIIVPAKSLTEDQYGNIPYRLVKELVDWAKSGKSKFGRFFGVGGENPQGLFPGIYWQAPDSNDLKCLVIFIDPMTYRKLIDLDMIATTTYQQEFDHILFERIAKTLSS